MSRSVEALAPWETIATATRGIHPIAGENSMADGDIRGSHNGPSIFPESPRPAEVVKMPYLKSLRPPLILPAFLPALEGFLGNR